MSPAPRFKRLTLRSRRALHDAFMSLASLQAALAIALALFVVAVVHTSAGAP